MRTDYFSMLGYVSVGLWLLVPVLWILQAKIRPRKWFCHIALVFAITAFVLAKINSTKYVNRIQLDMSTEVSEMQARQDAKLKEAEDDRKGDVADVRFAEDSAGDYLDRAGMEDSDLKYMDKLHEDVTPDWKKQKKQRSTVREEDDSVEALIGGKEESEGVDEALTEMFEEEDPVLMTEKERMLANKLDSLNLKVVRILILLAALYVVSDYLHRANSYKEAYLPMPLPSAWLNSMLPAKPLMTLPAKPRRSMLSELSWIAKRGDVFVYMTDKSDTEAKVPDKLASLFGRFKRKDVIRVKDDVPDKFVFEALWYGRSSFVITSSERAIQALGEFMACLLERKESRAKVKQTVHLVWDMTVPLDEEWQNDFAKLTKATGMSLVVCPV